MMKKPRISFPKIDDIVPENCLHVVQVVIHPDVVKLSLSLLVVLLRTRWVRPHKTPNVHEDLADIFTPDFLEDLAVK